MYRHQQSRRPAPVVHAPIASKVAGLVTDTLRQLTGPRAPGRLGDVPGRQTDIAALCTDLIGTSDSGEIRRLASIDAKDAATLRAAMQDMSKAARLLGEWWLQDRASFVDVTVGTGRIQELLRGMDLPAAPRRQRRHVPVTFASVPGEQHTLGLRMAAQLFRLDGWDIALLVGLEQDDLIAELQRSPGGIVGLSVCGTHAFAGLARTVEALRRNCPDTAIVVCGHAVETQAARLTDIDVDGLSSDIHAAHLQVAELWDRHSQTPRG